MKDLAVYDKSVRKAKLELQSRLISLRGAKNDSDRVFRIVTTMQAKRSKIVLRRRLRKNFYRAKARE